IHPISSIHLIILFSLVIIVFEKRISKWFKLLYIPFVAFFVGSIPFFILNYTTIRSNFPPDISITDHFYMPTISTEFLFDILPLLFIALFVCLNSQRENISSSEKLTLIFLILAVILTSTAFLTSYVSWLNILELQKMSKYLFLIPLIFISNYLGNKLKSRKGYHKFLPATVFLLLLFPAIYIQPSRQYIETTIHGQRNNPDLSDDVLKTEEVENFFELCNFCRINTPRDALFLAPLYGFSSFRIYAKRGLLVSDSINSSTVFSSSFTKRWLRAYNDVKTIYDYSGEALIRKFIKAYNVDYMIIKKSSIPIDWEKKTVFLKVFSNERYILLAFDKSFK
ncbi:hypothetical protein KKB18_00305, partial [bacterium]|nr:hypothetical protein [bacterium]